MEFKDKFLFKKVLVLIICLIALCPIVIVKAAELENSEVDFQEMVTEEQKAAIETQLDDLDKEIEMIAKVIYRECRSAKIPKEQKAAVVWCILNRVDSAQYPGSIKEVITQSNQFAWVSKTPVRKEFAELARDVLARWLLEKEGIELVGRTLPKEYLFFAAHNGRNRFRTKYSGGRYWNWSLPNPYEK